MKGSVCKLLQEGRKERQIVRRYLLKKTWDFLKTLKKEKEK